MAQTPTNYSGDLRVVRADDLAEASAAMKAGWSFAVRYRMRSGIVSSLFLTTEEGGTFAATYGADGFPLEKVVGITTADIIAFVNTRAGMARAA